MMPERRNKIKYYFFDVGGSMDAHVKICEELFSAQEQNLNTWNIPTTTIACMMRFGR